MCRSSSRHALVVRRLGQDPVDLHRPAARLVAPQVLDDLLREVLGARQVEHRRLRDARPRRPPAPEAPRPTPASRRARARRGRRSSARAAPVRITAPDASATARDRRRDRAHAALDVPPQPRHAVDLAQRVVQQVVRGAGRARPGPHADDAGRRGRALVAGRSRTSRRAGRRPTSSSRGRSRGCRAWTARRRAPPRAAARTGRPGAWSRAPAAGASISGRRKAAMRSSSASKAG